MMSLGVESVASERKMVASRVSVEGRIEHASQHRPSSVDDTPNPQSQATAGASGGDGQRAGSGEERSGVVMVSGIEHAWRLMPEGLQLEPITKPKSHTNVFASRALSPFQSVPPTGAKPQSAGSRPLRSRSGSPVRRKGMSESPVASKRALRSLVASASDPTHNPGSHAVVATAPEVLQAPGERTPRLSSLRLCIPYLQVALKSGHRPLQQLLGLLM